MTKFLVALTLAVSTSVATSGLAVDLIAVTPKPEDGTSACHQSPPLAATTILIHDVLQSVVVDLDRDERIDGAVALRDGETLEYWAFGPDLVLPDDADQRIDLRNVLVPGARELAMGDVNGDGQLDILVGVEREQLAVFYNQTAPLASVHFEPTPIVLDLPVEPLTLLAADLDRDDHDDVVVCGAACSVVWGAGATEELTVGSVLPPAPLAPRTPSSTSSRPSSRRFGLLPRAADLDPGGPDDEMFLDLAILDQSREQVDVYRHAAERTFVHEVSLTTGAAPADLLFADLIGPRSDPAEPDNDGHDPHALDGRAEFVIANRDDGTLTIYLNHEIDGMTTIEESPKSPLFVQPHPYSLGLRPPNPTLSRLAVEPIDDWKILVHETSNVYPLELSAQQLFNEDSSCMAGLPYECGIFLIGYRIGKRLDKLIDSLPCEMQVVDRLDEISVLAVAGPADQAKRLLGLKDVEYVEPNGNVMAAAGVGVPCPTAPWGLSKINARRAELPPETSEPILGVPDTGLDGLRMNCASIVVRENLSESQNGVPCSDDDGNGVVDDSEGMDFTCGHEQLDLDTGAYSWVPGYPNREETCDCDLSLVDGSGHGSAMAEIAVGGTRGGDIGVYPEAVVERIKVLDDTGAGNVLDVARGLEYAVERGVDVIVLALVATSPSLTLQRATAHADREEVVVVAAAGNHGNIEVSVPARHPDVLAVGAIEQSGEAWPCSNRGDGIDVVGPGVDVRDFAGNCHTGTSAAVAHCAGVALMLKDHAPRLSAERARAIIRGNAESFEHDPVTGFGLFDAERAVSHLLGCERGHCLEPGKDAPQQQAVRFRWFLEDSRVLLVDAGGLAGLVASQTN